MSSSKEVQYGPARRKVPSVGSDAEGSTVLMRFGQSIELNLYYCETYCLLTNHVNNLQYNMYSDLRGGKGSSDVHTDSFPCRMYTTEIAWQTNA